MRRVTGIGGVFFKSTDPEELVAWYQDHLGIQPREDGSIDFEWRERDVPHDVGYTVWAPFREDTTYFHPSEKPFMINFRVADLDSLLRQLKEEGVTVDERVEDTPFGRFGWIMDPERNRVELWEPVTKPDGAIPAAYSGVVVHGRGLGADAMADPDLQARLRRLFGFDPVPGTLNVMLPDPLQEPLASYVGWTDLGFSEDDPQVPGRRGLRYGSVLIEGQYQGIAFQGDEPEYPPTQVELISDRHLREMLGLNNLDWISFRILPTSEEPVKEPRD
ncbi:MAG: DUF120 domain-containing protein [Thermoplasmata archaeon]